MNLKSLLVTFILIGTFQISFSQINLNQNLVAYYKLDNNAVDSSTNGLNGTVNGATNDQGHIGKANTALKFDGSNDYVDVAHNSKFNLTKDKSVSAWYKLPSLTGITFYPSIVYKHGISDFPTFGLFLSEDPAYGSNRRKIGFFQGGNSVNKTVFTKEKYSDYINQWVHIVGTYSVSDGYMRIYFNGKLSDSLSVPNFTSNTSTEPLQIGRGSVINYSVNYFKGSIDEVRLYDRAITDKEVNALYNERVILEKTTNITICQPDSVFAQGEYRNKSGVYYDTVNLGGKCDSVYITNLTVNPSYYFPVTLTICQGNKLLVGGKFRTQAGIYYDSLKTTNGCDSIIEVTLVVSPSYYSTQLVDICQGESIIIGGVNRSTAGTYYDSLVSANGCDSIIVTTLVVNTKYTIQQTAEICNGGSILLGGVFQTSAGVYYDSLFTINGCDSVVVTTLVINPTYSANQTKTICQGDSILLGGSYQTTAGTYTDVLNTSKGCDSVIVTTLNVNPSYSISQSRTICQGDSAFIAGSYRFTAGTYTENFISTKGCDSIIITTLNINSSYLFTSSATICFGDSALINGQGYKKTAGVYIDSFSTANGCDSIYISILSVTTNSNAVIQNANVLVAQEGNATYQWLDCNNNNSPIVGETSQLFVATANGDYAVEIVKNGCTVVSNCVSVVGLSDNRIKTLHQSIKVYPNPATNWVKVELGKLYKTASVSVYTLEGKKISSSEVTNSNAVELNTTDFNKGIYLIEIIADGNRAYSKIAIEK